MKIASSDIISSSQHLSVEQHTLHESLRAWVGAKRPGFEERGRLFNPPAVDHVSLSAQGRAAQKADAVPDSQDEINNDPRMLLIISMVEAMTGMKIRIRSLKDFQSADTPAEPIQGPTSAGTQAASPAAGYGVEYERHETHYTAEQTSFQAQGLVKTADGREIAFNLQLSMHREHLEQSDVSVRLGDAVQQAAKDPLVINFNGSAAQLTAAKFSFDLDTDGKTEQISFAAPGSGFLALDRNQDGKINDGSELFGPASGDGFSELAAYDQDGNHWIDESDAVFTQLSVWSKDAQGNDQLATLKAAGIGALYLGSTATEFSLISPDVNHQLDGQVRSSGVYLNEDGSAGSLQQIDLAV